MLRKFSRRTLTFPLTPSRPGRLFPQLASGCARWSTRLLLVLLAGSLLFSASGDQKRITVYSVVANYSLPVTEIGGRDYVGLLEVLEPLGSVSATSNGTLWTLRYNNSEAEFTADSPHASVRGGALDLPASFQLQGGRGLVPVESLAQLLSRILGGPVALHLASRRVFIGSVAVHFTASAARTNRSTVVFNFSSPVNPMIATEPGKLQMTFTHEPLMGPSSSTLTFESKEIPSATYVEENGAAEITVSGRVPLLASFSNDGRTITVGPAPQAPPPTAASKTPAPAQAAVVTPNPRAQTPGAAAPAQVSATASYFAVIDASHGGRDPGETLASNLAEKDVTLAFARRLRQEFEARGLHALVLRDGDIDLSVDQRANLANVAHPAIYLCIHASSMGHGVRLYTAVLPAGGDDNGPFRNWSTAQSTFLPLSQQAAAALQNGLQSQGFAVRLLMAPLRPLNNIVAPAVAVELAPAEGGVNSLTSPEYQAQAAAGVVSGILAVRDKLGGGP